MVVYLISSGILGSGALLVQGMPWARLGLLTLNLGVFIFIYCAIAYKDGEKALMVRISNDKIRELIVQTGDDYKLDLDYEFSVRKGFIAGAMACIPLALFLLLDLAIGTPNNIAVKAVELFYMVFFGFFNIDFLSAHSIALYSSYYWTLISAPILIILHGVFYYLGAWKMQKRQDKIKSTHKRLHGE